MAVRRRLMMPVVAILAFGSVLAAGCGDVIGTGSEGGVSETEHASGESAGLETDGEETAGNDTTTTTTVAPEPETTTTVARVASPEIVRGLRVSEYVAADPARFDQLLDLADTTVVNTLVFDTKTEAGHVLYETDVAFADEIGAVRDIYDPAELIAATKERDLYTITRIVTFEDDFWSSTQTESQMGGTWVNAANEDNWDYPIDLAVEACRIGFDEIQFDYVRFPDGQAAQRSRSVVPATVEERTGVIADFLSTARNRLEAEGCATSAAIFGIVTASATDEGIGQTVDSLSGHVDAISPMLYPSHYGPGWIGYSDPNAHPGPVIAHALDSASPDLAPGTRMQPWIQAFYYNGAQIQAQITEAEQRGAGWLLWNYPGNYQADWVPAS